MNTSSIYKALFTIGLIAFAIPSFALEKTGTGFAISEDTIVTAYHVVESGESISITFGNASYPATITAFNKELDWAILKMSGKAPGTVVLGDSSKVKLGESVYSLGYPASDLLGDEIKYSKGAIGSLSGLAGSTDHFQISVPIQPGNSGGPLFTEDGRVVGIVVSTLDPGVFFSITDGALPQNINYALKIGLVPNLPTKPQPNQQNSLSVESNQRAIGLIKTKIARTAIAIPKQTLPKTPPRILPIDPYEAKLQEIALHAKSLLAKLTEFSPEVFCQTNGIACPIATEEETEEADHYLDSARLELEHYLETSQTALINSEERKNHFNNRYLSDLTRQEQAVFKDTPVSQEWKSAKNRLADHYNVMMDQNGVAKPTSFWKASFTPESFSSFIDWKETYKIQNTSVGQHKLPMDFFGVSDVFGIRSKVNGVPLALWCHIPTTHYEKINFGTKVISGKRVDWTGKPVSLEDREKLKSSQESLLRHVVKLFEKKYHIRFSISRDSNLVRTSDGFTEIIPTLLFKPDNFSSSKRYQTSSDLYSFKSDSIQILIRGFDEDEMRYSSPSIPFGILVFVCRPNWRGIADEEAFQHEKVKTIDVDESLLNAL